MQHAAVLCSVLQHCMVCQIFFFAVALLFATARFLMLQHCALCHGTSFCAVALWLVPGHCASCLMLHLVLHHHPCPNCGHCFAVLTRQKMITTINLYGIGQSMLIVVSLEVVLFPCVFAALVVVLAFKKIKTTTNLCGLGGILVLSCFLQ